MADYDIPGTGFAAFAAIFRHIGHHGLRNIVEMPEAKFQNLFVDLKYEEPELALVINELRFLRNPFLDIDQLHAGVSKTCTSFQSGQMFVPRIENLTSSAYYDYLTACGESRPNFCTLFVAWLKDVSNGLLAVDKKTAAKFIPYRHISEFELNKSMARFIIKNDLEKEFNEIPGLMIHLAKLNFCRVFISQIKFGIL